MRMRFAALSCAALLAGSLGPAVFGDWLVTREGARVETRGPWEVKGRQVVFTLENGTLSALRLDDVDLEASEAATAESRAPAPPPPPPPPKRKSVLSITDADVRRAPPPPSADEARRPGDGAVEGAAEGGAEGRGRPTRPAGSTEFLEVSSWRTVDSPKADGLELIGTVQNTGRDVAANVRVEVTILDQEGEELFGTAAFLRSTGIAPGGNTTFRAILPGIYQLSADPVFSIRAGRVSFTRPAAESRSASDELDAEGLDYEYAEPGEEGGDALGDDDDDARYEGSGQL